ncbi:hypothetical protein OG897_40595 [Streptomyces sp. NBC_00237]|uniref:hypothetical protein n=1 Tax=Streptomyces sp. NBC_00237 TaxID=2975687 RepID=UPI0022529448|nr:hypothetical protein [Streptomyces sp. NBC_00237]MCX5207684.1 hypothetical protein [Streptomyces sp. NBC_00237]
MIIGVVAAAAVLAPLSADAADCLGTDGPEPISLLVENSQGAQANALVNVRREKGGFRLKGALIVVNKGCARLESVTSGMTGGTSEIRRVCRDSHGGERRVSFSRWTKRPKVRVVIEDRWLPDKSSESKYLHGSMACPAP